MSDEIIDEIIDSLELTEIIQKTNATLSSTPKSLVHDSLSKSEIAGIMYFLDKVSYRLQSVLSRNTLKEIRIHTAAITQDTFVEFEKMCSSPSLNAVFQTKSDSSEYVVNLSYCVFRRIFEDKSPSQCNPSSREISIAQFKNFEENFLNHFCKCITDVIGSGFCTKDTSSSLNALNYVNDIYVPGVCCSFDVSVYDNESSDPDELLNHGTINLYFTQNTFKSHLSRKIHKLCVANPADPDKMNSKVCLGDINIEKISLQAGDIYPLSTCTNEDAIIYTKSSNEALAKGKIVLIPSDNNTPIERYGIQITEILF